MSTFRKTLSLSLSIFSASIPGLANCEWFVVKLFFEKSREGNLVCCSTLNEKKKEREGGREEEK